MASGILLSTTESLDKWLQAIFGIAHLDDYAGNICYLCGGLCFICHALERLAPTNVQRQIIKLWLEGPLTLVIALMFSCLVMGQGCDDRLLLTHSPGPFDWLDAYALCWHIGMAYLFGFCGWLMYQLRTEKRNYALWMYIGTSVSVIIGCILRASASIFDSDTLDHIAYAFGITATILMCAAASWSWRQKMAPYRELIRATRTRPTPNDLVRSVQTVLSFPRTRA